MKGMSAAEDQNSKLPVPATKSGQDPALFRLESEKTDMGRADSFRYNVLTWVLDERYDRAIQEIKTFMDTPSQFPNFHGKIGRYMSHSIDLIYAIKAKRNFPGISSLTRAKQQELREKFKEHFKELQMILKRVEEVERDLKIHDARSTIYVIKAIWVASLAIIILAFFLEIVRGLGETTAIVADDTANRVNESIFNLIGM
jgi:hypothetical protein